MNLFKKLLQQRKALLFNGQEVKEGDKVSFTNSDGVECTQEIKRREDGTLFFWNSGFEIVDYQNARKTTQP